MGAITLPPFSEASERLRGRNLRAGYQRGWGLQFGDLRQQVRRNELYREACRFAEGRTVVAEDNRMNLFLIVTMGFAELAPGHIVEFGAYRGGNALFLAKLCQELYPDMKVYAFDTFSGMPVTDKTRDAHRGGDFADVGFEELQDTIAKYNFKNVELVRGRFEETALKTIGSVRLNHVDCDIYSGVVYSYDVSKPYMVEGGYWAFDDALYSSCIGAMEAIEEVVVQRDGRFAEQSWPHLVYRNFEPAI